jgi:CspA family cold shock protein
MSDVITGTVKWFNAAKGYGFIATVDHGEVYVHLRALAEGRATLAAGDLVYFSLRPTEKGAEAANVRVGLPPAPPKPALPTLELATPALPGTVAVRVVCRPAALRELGRTGQAPSLVAFVLDPAAAPAAALPKGLPAASAPTGCLVLISIKHWRRVADALEADADDTLVVDGYAGLDPLAPGMIVLRATSVTTTATLNAERAAWAARRAEIAGQAGEGASPQSLAENAAGSGESE